MEWDGKASDLEIFEPRPKVSERERAPWLSTEHLDRHIASDGFERLQGGK